MLRSLAGSEMCIRDRYNDVAERVIANSIAPSFMHRDFDQGAQNGANAFIAEIALPEFHAANQTGQTWWTVAILVLTTLVASSTFVLISWTFSGRRGWGWIIVGLIYIQYLRLRNILSRDPKSKRASSDPWCDSASGAWNGDSWSGSDGGGLDCNAGGGATGEW